MHIPGNATRMDSLRRLPADKVLLEPLVWSEDFESGTTAGWESYPPFEDTAYDFTLFPGRYIPPEEVRGGIQSSGEAYPLVGVAPPERAEGNRHYLLRAVRPEGVHGRRIGVWCKTPSLWSAEDLSMGFDYWLEDRLGTARLEVHVAGADGVRYIASLDPSRRQWERPALPRSAFRAEGTGRELPGDVAIDAIAVVMDLAEADPSAYAYLALDNVEVRGRGPVRPDYRNIDVKRYGHWAMGMVEKAFHPATPLDIPLVLPRGTRKASLRLAHSLQAGVVHDVPLHGSGGEWRPTEPFMIPPSGPAGPWTALVEGEDDAGRIFNDTIRFWVLGQPATGRPRLFLDRDGLEGLRVRASGDPAYQAIRVRAGEARSELPPEDPGFDVYMKDYLLPEIGTYFEALRVPSYGALENGWVYQVEQNREAGEHAREVLLRMARWNRWVHPNFDCLGRRTYYLVGIVALNLAITYDLVYDLLTEEERQVVRDGMMRNAIAGGWEEYFLHNRIASNTSNWINGTVAGPLVAVLSLFDDPAGFPREFFGLAEKWFAHLRASFLPDGSYGEGYGYQSFASYMSAPAFAALSHCFKVPGLVESFNWKDSNLFNMYIQAGGNVMLDMGDSYDTLRPTTHLSWLAKTTGDPLINGFYQLAPGDDWRSFLWRPDEKNVTVPSECLPPSRIFPDKGSSVFRTGWDGDSTVLHFRAGPNFNHTHADQGHFLLWAHGEPLAIEAGKSHYYDNPFYWSFHVHAGAHNVLLVDGNPHSQEIGDFRDEVPAFDRYARLVAGVHGEGAGLLLSDLAPVYQGKLTMYERALAFTPAGNLLVWDLVRTAGRPRRLEVLYNPPSASRTRLLGDQIVYTGGKAGLSVRVLQPSRAVVSMRKVPTYLGEMRQNPDPHSPGTRQAVAGMECRSVVTVSTPGPADEASFLMAYLPHPSGEKPAGEVTPMKDGAGLGASLMEEGREILVMLGTDGITMDDVQTDARMLMLEKSGDGSRRLWVLQGSFVRIGDARVLECDDRGDCVLSRDPNGSWQVHEPSG